MTITVINRFVSSTTSNGEIIRTLRLWGDAMEPWGYSTSVRLVNNVRTGQFSHIVPVMLDANGNQIADGSANTLFSNISPAEYQKIAALQIPDSKSVDAKMQWLTNGGNGQWGCPMRATYNPSANWRNATDIDLIGGVWAGQQVEILESRIFPSIRYNNAQYAGISLHRIRTFQPADWGKTYASHPHLVQKVTAVSADDTPLEPQGIVYLPLILSRAASCWIFSEWLL